jgi:hypothetical protein
MNFIFMARFPPLALVRATEIPNQKIVRCGIAVCRIVQDREPGRKKPTDGDFKTKTKLVLAAALILGAGSLAQAANENDGGNETGGFVHPPSADGVNPAYHPGWFPGYAANPGNAGQAYGYAASPKKTHRVTHAQTQNR